MGFLQFPIILLWCFTESLLVLCGQDPEISAMAGEYIRYLIPGLFPFMIYECVKRYILV
jgi:MATE family multidrug resistance protein